MLDRTLNTFFNMFRASEKPYIEEGKENLHATGHIDTTINDVDKTADDWVEQVSKQEAAVKDDTYLKLDGGVLAVNQLNDLLNTLPIEITYADSNNQFLYYNYHLEKGDMLADRHPSQVGNPLADCHPTYAIDHAQKVIKELRTGETDTYRINAPNEDPNKFVVHNYKAMKDDKGHFAGVHEYVEDIAPLVRWYLEQTGQELIKSDGVDAVSSASQNN